MSKFLTTEQQVIGDPLLLEFTIKTYQGTLTDPTEVTVKVKLETGEVEEFDSLIHPSTGIYQLTYTPETQGRYHVRLETTGALISADEWMFDVGYSQFA